MSPHIPQNKAQALYTVMLERFTANVNLIRLYAMFLARVKLKPGRALRLLEKADRIEDENAKQRMLTQGECEGVWVGVGGGSSVGVCLGARVLCLGVCQAKNACSTRVGHHH